MVISQTAAMELAESCARVERPFRLFFAWLRGAPSQPTRMLMTMPGGGEMMPRTGPATLHEPDLPVQTVKTATPDEDGV